MTPPEPRPSSAPEALRAPAAPPHVPEAPPPEQPALPPAEAAIAALRSAWHLAVVAGPETGWCVGVPVEGVTLGRAASRAAPALTDPLVSRRHLRVRERRGRIEARDLCSANGTRHRPPRHRLRRGAAPRHPGRWARPLGRRWQVVAEGGRLEIGHSVLEVRRRPARLRAPDPPEPEPPRPARDWMRLAMPLVMCAAMLPVLLIGPAGPWRLLLLAVPVMIVLTVVLGRRGRRPPRLPDPAALLLLAATRPPPPPESERLRLRLDVGDGRRQEHLELADGDRVAVIGPSAAGNRRWLVAQLAAFGARVLAGETVTGPAAALWRVSVSEPEPVAPAATAPTPAPGGADRARHEAHLVLVGSLREAPTWCSRVLTATGPGVGEAWSAAAAALLTEEHATEGGTLPQDVRLADLLGPARAVGRSWRDQPPGLCAPIGVSTEGPVELDLAEHGPHALLAGTTGAGKSEMLLAWLLALAVRHSPADVQLVLVDYKGGATFGPLADLPHTAGVLTDLDPAGTARALTSLRAEVQRRERLLAGAGAKDLLAYRRSPGAGERLPRLLVVVDEFRALADSHPDLLDALVRLATQGRSLGIHLILATQRPGGSVNGEVRANLTVRICLRVLEATESHDVVGTAAAAELPRVPGRAVVRTDRPVIVQAPWCGPQGWAAEVIAAARRAWHEVGGGEPPGRPWAPPLPERLALPPAPQVAGTLAVGMMDLPAQQRLGTWHWAPEGLLVLGGTGTGRTTALLAIGAAALRAGLAVHVVAARPALFAGLAAPRLGTVTPAGDPRRVARLLEVLAEPGILLIDDVDEVVEQLDLVTGAGQGAGRLARAVRDGRRSGLHSVLSGPMSLGGARWLETVRTRLVLAPRDETEALVAGVPRELLGAPASPGRGVLLEPRGATAVHVAAPGPAELRLPGAPDPSVRRVAPLPAQVSLAELRGAAGEHTVPIGCGGDDGGPVLLPCGPGEVVLVSGPPGSGRSTAVEVLRRQLAGRRALVAPAPGEAIPAMAGVLVLDDLDRWPAHQLEELAAAVGDRTTIVAAARSEAVAAAYRGPLATWRVRSTLVLLRPGSAASGQLTDVSLETAVDPARPFHPGLAAVVRGGRATPVQVAQVTAGGRVAEA